MIPVVVWELNGPSPGLYVSYGIADEESAHMKRHDRRDTMSRPAIGGRWAGPLFLILLMFGCSTAPDTDLRPGTGDISFRLIWEGDADLDLHVEDPGGRHTGIMVPMGRPTAEASLEAFKAQLEAEQELGPKGVLDIDCNGSPEKMCERPMENVFWPPGSALEGRYGSWVYLYQPRVDPEEKIPFVLEVREGEKVVRRFRGEVGNEGRESERFVYRFGR